MYAVSGVSVLIKDAVNYPTLPFISLWFRVWRHLLALTYHCCVRCFGSNQQSCVQGRLAPWTPRLLNQVIRQVTAGAFKTLWAKEDSYTWPFKSFPMPDKPGKLFVSFKLACCNIQPLFQSSCSSFSCIHLWISLTLASLRWTPGALACCWFSDTLLFSHWVVLTSETSWTVPGFQGPNGLSPRVYSNSSWW